LTYPCGTGFADTQYVGVTGSWRLLLRFQRKVREARVCVIGPGYLKAALEKVMCEAMWIKEGFRKQM
jgi:hypothetical protein